MNILIKLTCLIGLVVAPILGGHTEEGLAMVDSEIEIERAISVENNDTSEAQAKVTTTKTLNGQVEVIEKSFEGTLDEVTEEASEYAKAQKEKEKN